jgi:hypothetical protein
MTGVNLSYGTVRYSRGAFKANFFTNIMSGGLANGNGWCPNHLLLGP